MEWYLVSFTVVVAVVILHCNGIIEAVHVGLLAELAGQLAKVAGQLAELAKLAGLVAEIAQHSLALVTQMPQAKVNKWLELDVEVSSRCGCVTLLSVRRGRVWRRWHVVTETLFCLTALVDYIEHRLKFTQAATPRPHGRQLWFCLARG